MIPGGTRFISSAARFRLAQAERDTDNQDFVAELARFLSAPMVLDYAERVRDMVEELRSLQEFMVQLDERYPAVMPSLAAAATSAGVDWASWRARRAMPTLSSTSSLTRSATSGGKLS